MYIEETCNAFISNSRFNYAIRLVVKRLCSPKNFFPKKDDT